MKNDPEIDFAEAHFPDRWTIMDVRLGKFLIGHKLILQRAKSPFLAGGDGDIKLEDLIFALWVCSRPYSEAQRFQEKPSLLWRYRASRISRACERNEELFFSRVEMFLNYLAEAHTPPKRMRQVKKDGESEPESTIAPSLMVLQRELMGKACFSDEQFFEMPLRVAYYKAYALMAKEDGSFAWPEGWEVGRG